MAKRMSKEERLVEINNSIEDFLNYKMTRYHFSKNVLPRIRRMKLIDANVNTEMRIWLRDRDFRPDIREFMYKKYDSEFTVEKIIYAMMYNYPIDVINQPDKYDSRQTPNIFNSMSNGTYEEALRLNYFDPSLYDASQTKALINSLDRRVDLHEKGFDDSRLKSTSMDFISRMLMHGYDPNIVLESIDTTGVNPEILDANPGVLRFNLYENSQLMHIEDAITHNINLTMINRPGLYNGRQMELIISGLERGLDVYQYNDPHIPSEKMAELYTALSDGMDISEFSNPEYSRQRMSMIREGIKHGLDITKYNDPNIDDSKARLIVNILEEHLPIEDESIFEKSYSEISDYRIHMHHRDLNE